MARHVFMDYFAWLDVAEMPRGKKAVLKAAAELFSAQGFNGTSTAQIAEQAGMSQATIFKYFGTKEALLIEILSPMIDEVKKDFWEQLTKETEIRTIIHFFVQNRWQFLIANQMLIRIIFEQLLTNYELQQLINEKISSITETANSFFIAVKQKNVDIDSSLTITQSFRIFSAPLIAYFVQIYILHQPAGDQHVELAIIEEQILCALTRKSH